MSSILDRIVAHKRQEIAAAGEEVYVGVEGPDKLVKAEVIAHDYAMDRCVVSERDVRLHPVAGVRRYDSLEIGETVYAIGNPARLERTLSNGLLSGKRVIEDRRYLQTTAPICFLTCSQRATV